MTDRVVLCSVGAVDVYAALQFLLVLIVWFILMVKQVLQMLGFLYKSLLKI